MKVLFLDLDGVLNTFTSRRRKGLSYYSDIIDEDKLRHIKEIVKKTECEIVLTSSWRKYWNNRGTQIDSAGKAIQNAFNSLGLTIYSKTPVIENAYRNQEIVSWLKNNGMVEQYVILDDKDFQWSEDLRRHWVACSDETGFTATQIDVAVNILNGNLLPADADSNSSGMGIFWKFRKWATLFFRKGT